jgi:acyl transferase domain-containing protein
MERIQNFVQTGSASSLYDLAFTFNTRREKLPHRAFIVVNDREILQSSGLAKVPVKTQDVYLIFSGQGAQWAGMYSLLVIVER